MKKKNHDTKEEDNRNKLLDLQQQLCDNNDNDAFTLCPIEVQVLLRKADVNQFEEKKG